MVAILNFRTRLVFFLSIILFSIMTFFYTLLNKLPSYDLGDSRSKFIPPEIDHYNNNYNHDDKIINSTKKYLDVEVREDISFNVEPEEKFLAYFTHSGYHNQRIALENALLLSKLLNRTLLLPPVLLGPPVPWSRFDKLYERLFLITKNGLNHCMNIPKGYPLPVECLNYFTYTKVSWDFLLNMKPIREWNKLIDRWDHSFEWLEHKLGINKDKDIHFIKDTTLWDYRIYDKNSSEIPFIKYNRKFLIEEDLKNVEKKLIHFGSLFGSYRVLPENFLSKNYLKFIKKNLIINNSIIKKSSDIIIKKLGGKKNFLGIHIRVSDGFFMKSASKNIDIIYHNIINNFTNLSFEEVDKLEGGTHYQDILDDENVDLGNDEIVKGGNETGKGENDGTTTAIAAEIAAETAAEIVKIATIATATTETELTVATTMPDRINNNNDDDDLDDDDDDKLEFSKKVKCKKPLHPTDKGVNNVIFIATDIKSPRSSPLLFKFFNTFPCVFVLDDFDQDLLDIKSVRNIHDKTPLSSYLIPMLDAMISAKGFRFIGTPRSTFSNYIEKTLHPIYTGQDISIDIIP